jgi:hypothetical protein
MSFINETWKIHIILFILVLTSALIKLLQIYFVPIVAVLFLVYSILNSIHQNQKFNQKYFCNQIEEDYYFLSDSLFEIFQSLENILPIMKAFDPSELRFSRGINFNQNIVNFYFKLDKKILETVEKNKIHLARQVLQSKIDAYLELEFPDNNQYRDMSFLQVIGIRDYGSYFAIKIVLVSHDNAYAYVQRHKEFKKDPPAKKNDELF